MKILHVSGGGDYTGWAFEEEFNGTPVREIIEKVESGEWPEEKEMELDGELYDVYFKIHSVGDVDKGFLSFVRNEVEDEEDVKHRRFWIENETI